nr:ATP-binding protein [Streptomyces venezuelae]
MIQEDCMQRKPWELAFLAAPEEVAALRRLLRLHLGVWGLHELVDAAQLCVTELVTNVVTHVGVGTPTRLAVAMRDTYLRIEVQDPDAKALPTLLSGTQWMPQLGEAESGRGLALVDAVADRWGVQPRADGKVTWCELRANLSSPYGAAVAIAGRMPAIEMIADILHWLYAHGHDPDDALNCAQTRFETEIKVA